MDFDKNLYSGMNKEYLIEIIEKLENEKKDLKQNMDKVKAEHINNIDELNKYKRAEEKDREHVMSFYNLDEDALAKMTPKDRSNREFNIIKKQLQQARREYFLRIHREREDRLVLKDRERIWAREEMESELENTKNKENEQGNDNDILLEQEASLELIEDLESILRGDES